MTSAAQPSGQRESDNYFWNEATQSDFLGRGSFGTVFKCFKKGHRDTDATTEVYAVKVCHKGHNFKKAETDIWKAVSNHDHVVKMLSVEKELQHNVDVIIMEYCNGGSLHDYLGSLGNSYGLPESDLLAVLHDLAAGLGHLRRYKVSHRDIKPLNIMRCTTSRGASIFKLADFGDARVLGTNDAFNSTPGTTVYAHPSILRKGVGKELDTILKSTIDLWSIGVTMYECISGRLPFLDLSHLSGREIGHALNEMYKIRPKDTISGILKDGDRLPEWNFNYPRDCLISRELMDLLLPIQRCLFNEEDYNFNSFFDNIKQVVQSRKVQALDVFGAKLYNLFITSGFKTIDIRLALQLAMGVDVTEAVLLCSDGSLLSDDNVDKVLSCPVMLSARSGPAYDRMQPVFVICSNSIDNVVQLSDLVDVELIKAKVILPEPRKAECLRTLRMKTAVEAVKAKCDLMITGMLLKSERNAVDGRRLGEACASLLACMLELLCKGARRVLPANELSAPAQQQQPAAVDSAAAATADSAAIAGSPATNGVKPQNAIEQGKIWYGKVAQLARDICYLEQILLSLSAPAKNEAIKEYCAVENELTRHLGIICYLCGQIEVKWSLTNSSGFEDDCKQVMDSYEKCRTCLERLQKAFRKWIEKDRSPCSETDTADKQWRDSARSLHNAVTELDKLSSGQDALIGELFQTLTQSAPPKAAPDGFKPGCVHRDDLQQFHEMFKRLQEEAKKATANVQE